MASKPAIKTYGRNHSKTNAASKAFDDAVSGRTQQMKNTKWGSTSVVRIRDEDPFEATYNKVKTEIETEDPFSFGGEGDGFTVKSEEPAQNMASVGGLGRPALAGTSSSKTRVSARTLRQQDEARRAASAIEEPEGEEIQPVFRRPVRTYSKSKKGEESPSKIQTDSNPFEDEEEGVMEEETEEDDENEMPVLEPERPMTPPTSTVVVDNFGFGEDQNIAGVHSGEPVYEEEVSDAPSLNQEPVKYEALPQKRNKKRVTAVSGASNYSKKHVLQSDDVEQAPTVLNFRSAYMDPAVYSKFNYTPRDDDPVGRLSNSKVLQKSEIKHGKGSTLIVICSPKPTEGKQKLLQQKTTRDPYRKYVKEETAASSSSKKSKSKSDSQDSFSFDEESQNSEASPGTEQMKTRRAAKRKTDNGETTGRVNKIFRSRNRGQQVKAEAEVKEEEDEQEISKESEVKEETKPNGEADVPPEEDATIDEKNTQEEIDSTKNEMSKVGTDGGENSQTAIVIDDTEQSSTPDEQATPESSEVAMEVESNQEESQSIQSDSQSELDDSEAGDSSQNILESSQGSTDGDSQSTSSNSRREKKIFKSKNKVDLQRKVFQRSPLKKVRIIFHIELPY